MRTTGRLVEVFTDSIDFTTQYYEGAANYMIIAVRGAEYPVQVEATTWGQLKQKY